MKYDGKRFNQKGDESDDNVTFCVGWTRADWTENEKPELDLYTPADDRSPISSEPVVYRF